MTDGGRMLWMVDEFRKAGLTVRAVSGWETRGAPTMAPKGIVWHHTVSAQPVDALLVTGHKTVPGPLSHWSTHPDGSITVIASGRANHAGAQGEHNPLAAYGATSNSDVAGDELVHPGTAGVPWPQIQLDAAAHATAVFLDHYNLGLERITTHRMWTAKTPDGSKARKIDPINLPPATIKALVKPHLSATAPPVDPRIPTLDEPVRLHALESVVNLLIGHDAAFVVTAFYSTLFDRTPDPAGLAYWAGEINSGRLSVYEVWTALAASPEARKL